jgi:hypothetical protein
MASFIPGTVTPKRRRAAMQAALFTARQDRLARIAASEVVIVPSSMGFKIDFNKFANLGTDGGPGFFTDNSISAALATKWKFSLVDHLGADATGFLSTFVAGSASPHKTKVTMTSTNGATYVFYVNSDDVTAGGFRSFNTTPISASGSESFGDVFTATVVPQ